MLWVSTAVLRGVYPTGQYNKGEIYLESLKVKLLKEGARPPVRGTDGSAGYDLFACLDAPVEIRPGDTVRIPTGIAIELEPGYGGFLFARSSLGIHHNLVPANCVAVIDWDYRGELIAGLINQGKTPYTLQPGDRFAQLVILPVSVPTVEICDTLSETQRGTGGFGSTGK